MASIVSATALEPHLHIDPSLHLEKPSKVTCCAISCCMRPKEREPERYVYCNKMGHVTEFKHELADDEYTRFRKTSQRVAHLVNAIKPLEEIQLETGVDLISKSVDGLPISIDEIKRIQKVLQ